jgi:hypothetical protein
MFHHALDSVPHGGLVTHFSSIWTITNLDVKLVHTLYACGLGMTLDFVSFSFHILIISTTIATVEMIEIMKLLPSRKPRYHQVEESLQWSSSL